jgi:spermidine/putrescine transport system permease protein
MLVPSLFMGMALLTMFFQFGVVLSMTTIVIGHVTRVLPFVFLSLMAQQAGYDRRVEEAAMDLGANSWQVFSRVTLPSMLPGIVAATLFAFTLSLDEFNMSFLLTGTETTVPIYMWGMLRTTLSPSINALSTIFILVSVGLVLIGQVISAARRKRP